MWVSHCRCRKCLQSSKSRSLFDKVKTSKASNDHRSWSHVTQKNSSWRITVVVVGPYFCKFRNLNQKVKVTKTKRWTYLLYCPDLLPPSSVVSDLADCHSLHPLCGLGMWCHPQNCGKQRQHLYTSVGSVQDINAHPVQQGWLFLFHHLGWTGSKWNSMLAKNLPCKWPKLKNMTCSK